MIALGAAAAREQRDNCLRQPHGAGVEADQVVKQHPGDAELRAVKIQRAPASPGRHRPAARSWPGGTGAYCSSNCGSSALEPRHHHAAKTRSRCSYCWYATLKVIAVVTGALRPFPQDRCRFVERGTLQ